MFRWKAATGAAVMRLFHAVTVSDLDAQPERRDKRREQAFAEAGA
ncbi:hypothetical protein AB0H49_22600 [Nocardia sp. NPDC050713]